MYDANTSASAALPVDAAGPASRYRPATEGVFMTRCQVRQLLPAESASGMGMVEKAVLVLDVLGSEGRSLRLIELVRRTQLSKTTTLRLLNILLAKQLVHRCGNEYVLGDRIFQWAATTPAEQARAVKQASLPFLIDLYEMNRGTISVGILQHAEVHYLNSVYGHQAAGPLARVLDHAPAHCTAIGKLLLAYEHNGPHSISQQHTLERLTPHTVSTMEQLEIQLADIRATGVAYNREEYVIGVGCVAAPITGRHGRPVAALAIGDRLDRFDPDTAVKQVRHAAFTISVAIRATLAHRHAGLDNSARQSRGPSF